jgi:cytochrome c peroxidase
MHRFAAKWTFLGLSLSLVGCGSEGAGTPTPDPCQGLDLRTDTCAEAKSMLLPATLPEARGNAHGDDDDAAMLGFQLFFDSDLGNGVGCVQCHAPEAAFTDRKPVSTGRGVGTRNAPTAFNAARLRVIFWDGRADSVWSQPLFAIENPLEMDSSRLQLAHLIAGDTALRPAYEKVFGPLPDLSAWPASGKPGDAAFDALAPDVQTEANRIAANVGKALEAYMRKNTSGPSMFDAYLGGDTTQITDVAKRGLEAFVDAKCVTCHSGPMLTDEGFHDVGFPSLPGAAPDPGRSGGIPILEANPFNLGGPYADPGTDAVAPQVETGVAPGEFRTPSLRNVAHTAPYGHDGALTTLDDVLALHAPGVDADTRGTIISFLQTLNGATPPRPWSNWPSPQ